MPITVDIFAKIVYVCRFWLLEETMNTDRIDAFRRMFALDASSATAADAAELQSTKGAPSPEERAALDDDTNDRIDQFLDSPDSYLAGVPEDIRTLLEIVMLDAAGPVTPILGDGDPEPEPSEEDDEEEDPEDAPDEDEVEVDAGDRRERSKGNRATDSSNLFNRYLASFRDAFPVMEQACGRDGWAGIRDGFLKHEDVLGWLKVRRTLDTAPDPIVREAGLKLYGLLLAGEHRFNSKYGAERVRAFRAFVGLEP